MLASDHGFSWIDDRPTQVSSNAQATAAKWHRKDGIYLLWGPVFRRRTFALKRGRCVRLLRR